MAMFVLTDAVGIGTGDVDSNGVFVDLVAIANDTGIGLDPEVPGSGTRRVAYAPTVSGAPQTRLDLLVNTDYTPDYGAGPQAVDIVVVSVPDDFVFGDGSFGVVDNGTALSPMGSGRPGSTLNPTVNCLVLYDTALDICVARAGTGGTIDLGMPGPVILYHELSHAFRIVQDSLLSLAGGCDPSSPEEQAAIVDENDMRTQFASLLGGPVVLRDPDNHCGGVCPAGSDTSCCIVATAASGSTRSEQVQRLRRVRDHTVRRTEVGFTFFDQLFEDYYSFSPQISAMIAGRPELRRLVLSGYVEPLLDFWELMTELTEHPVDTDAELGRLLRAHAPTGHERADRLAAMGLARAWWDGDLTGPLAAESVRELLRSRAWTKESVRWALLRPVDIYERVLRAADDDATDAVVGHTLRTLLDTWAPDLPIAPLWGALDTRQARRALASCDRMLLHGDTARRRFRQRLLARYGDVTSVRAAVDVDPPLTREQR